MGSDVGDLNIMEEGKLPKELLDKVSISPSGKHAWKKDSIPEVLSAAKKVSLACVVGQPNFQGSIEIAEPYWITYEPEPRKEGESWESYAIRSNNETLEAFEKVCEGTDFLKKALKRDHIRSTIENDDMNPLDHP